MKKILFFISFVLVASFASAQEQDNILDRYEKLLLENKQLSDDYEKLKKNYDALNRQHNSDEKEIKRLNAELQKKEFQAQTRIEQASDIATQEVEAITRRNNELEKQVKDLQATNDLYFQQLNVAFKSIVIYPLLVKYKKSNIDEAFKSAKMFAVDPDLKATFNDYRPLLQNYKNYNDNLVEALDRIKTKSEEFVEKMKGMKNAEVAVRNRYIETSSNDMYNILKSTEYFKYRSTPAFTQKGLKIGYLENIIEDFEGRRKDLRPAFIDGLIQRLVPVRKETVSSENVEQNITTTDAIPAAPAININDIKMPSNDKDKNKEKPAKQENQDKDKQNKDKQDKKDDKKDKQQEKKDDKKEKQEKPANNDKKGKDKKEMKSTVEEYDVPKL